MATATLDARAQYLAVTEKIPFTKDFNPSLEALMVDPAATYGQRFLAWLKRRSWGNYRLYAVLDSGEPAAQVDCSRELGIDKRIVSNLVNYYEKRGYLYREGKLLYPSISPKVTPPPEKVTHSSDFSEFIEQWKVTHSSDFLELEVARSTVKRLEKVKLSLYKKWRTSRTNGDPTLYEIKTEIEREEPTASQPNVKVEDVGAPQQAGRLAADRSDKITSPQEPAPEANSKPAPEIPSLKAEIRQHLESIPIPEKPSDDVVAQIAAHITTPELLDQFKETTAPHRFTKGPPRKWSLIIAKAKETASYGAPYVKAKTAAAASQPFKLRDILRGSSS